MSFAEYTFWQCLNDSCHFRFPAMIANEGGGHCPKCRGTIKQVFVPDGQAAVETAPAPHAFAGAGISRGQAVSPTPHIHLEILLDNIRSVYNVGAMFRTADGAGVRHVHLSGISAPPTHPKIAKTALGAQNHLPWSYVNNGLETAVSLKDRGYQLWALEAAPNAQPLFSANLKPMTQPVLFVVGSEKAGVDPGILSICDRVFSLPMQGFKGSLNVAVAFGIALYTIQFR